MAAKGVVHTDGLAGDPNAGAVGAAAWDAATDQVTPKTRGEKRSRVAKDYLDDQKVFENDELAPAWPQTRDVRRSTPESA